MQCPGDELLARSRLSSDEYRIGTPCGILDRGSQALHLDASTEQAAEVFITLQRLPLEQALDFRHTQDGSETKNAVDGGRLVTRDPVIAVDQEMGNSLAPTQTAMAIPA